MKEPTNQERIEELQNHLQLRCSQLQELAEILTGQPGTVCHFNGLREIALDLVARAKDQP